MENLKEKKTNSSFQSENGYFFTIKILLYLSDAKLLKMRKKEDANHVEKNINKERKKAKKKNKNFTYSGNGILRVFFSFVSLNFCVIRI